MKLAGSLGLRTPECRLALPGSSHPIGLFSRFDRRQGGRVPYISARTALGKVGHASGYYVSGARTPSVFQLDGFWKAQGIRSSMRDAGWFLAMAVRVSRR